MNPEERPDDVPDLNELLKHLMGGGDDMREALSEMGLGNIDPAMFAQMQQQVAAMMAAPSDGSFNIEAARDVARRTVSTAGDPSIGPSTARDVDQVVMVAGLWLDQVTNFAGTGAGKAWSRSEWVEATMPTWRRLVEPISDAVNAAVMRAMREQMGQLGAEQLDMPPQMLGQLEPMLGRMSSAVFSMQLGQAVGTLAGELVTGTEVGLPLVEGNPVVIMPTNVAKFAEGLDMDAGELHLYLAVREAARTRLFQNVPWLGPALIAAVQSYAADISIDTDAIEEAMRNADMQDPSGLQEAISGSIFRPEPSEAQKRTLAHLETLLALVEGWVDVVSDRAVRPHLPHADKLAEIVRRRRATGGPAEKVFASLVGLELRPRRMRDAANLFAVLEDAKGAEGRDAAWKHPDFAPGANDLDDPMGYLEGGQRSIEEPAGDARTDAMDDALAALLAQGREEMESERKSDTPEAAADESPESDNESDNGSGDSGDPKE
ncbi:zinc-dependent metalloprotease [Calidifontibacter indicus]|uniref:Putative hydrolase n=1 Tax=Calidifontibacter indicus TaxID=419650 RepID=A0A3D9UR51_9MICO|nr:zinc-dependent metalloprotease [Calidifontibacter indicus]REF31932.1 putative hydrolase [Calidifontibacter indicus]